MKPFMGSAPIVLNELARLFDCKRDDLQSRVETILGHPLRFRSYVDDDVSPSERLLDAIRTSLECDEAENILDVAARLGHAARATGT